MASFKQGPVEPSSTLGSILDLVARSGFWACLEVCSGCWPGPWNTRRPGAYIPISLVVESVIFRLDQDPALIRQLACIALARVVRSERDGRQFLCTALGGWSVEKTCSNLIRIQDRVGAGSRPMRVGCGSGSKAFLYNRTPQSRLRSACQLVKRVPQAPDWPELQDVRRCRPCEHLDNPAASGENDATIRTASFA